MRGVTSKLVDPMQYAIFQLTRLMRGVTQPYSRQLLRC